MRADTLTFQADDGKGIFVHRFLPDEGTQVKAFVHVAHGMAEHGARYARFAEALTKDGYAVHADDHRGHGKTAVPMGNPAGSSELGWAGERGFDRMVRDLVELLAFGRKEHPGMPVFLFGHSMGSFLAQEVLIREGITLRGAILSGTGGKPNLLASAGRLVARVERLRLGARGMSELLNGLSFQAFNKAFAPNRTAFDWLSRDEAEVDKYIADPLCGFPVSTQLWVDFLDGLAAISRADRQAKIPPSLPIYVFAGSEDPVGERTKSIDQLLGAYRAAGLRDVTHRYYPGARHETLNETNRDEVTRDVLAWLDAHLG